MLRQLCELSAPYLGRICGAKVQQLAEQGVGQVGLACTCFEHTINLAKNVGDATRLRLEEHLLLSPARELSSTAPMKVIIEEGG
jgi:hypothetical protein